ncbi:hypothetical protein [Dyadobacter fermentans]|uniref:hypothetical protein n=1 Tax=Dyadobacter fermentans TaxID=94254 RepID=UPI00019B5C8C|nr:hypothetical protein [Dyadobacter fermentans]
MEIDEAKKAELSRDWLRFMIIGGFLYSIFQKIIEKERRNGKNAIPIFCVVRSAFFGRRSGIILLHPKLAGAQKDRCGMGDRIFVYRGLFNCG